MDTRYHIEEMVSQDAKGVVFQGMDSVTGVVVAMRRYVLSGGDRANEQDRHAYSDAIEVLKKVSHASLRKVLAGGCDPVDELPYLVTRWAEGTPLGDLLARNGEFEPDFASYVLDQLLETNAAVSEVVGREALWLETTVESILVKPARSADELPVISFWLCPWSWLQQIDPQAAFAELADFAEIMLGGPRNVASRHANHILAKWIQKVRQNTIPGFAEARRALNATASFKDPFAKEVNPPEMAETVKRETEILEATKAAEVKVETAATIEPSVRETDLADVGFDPPGLQIAPAPVPVSTAKAVLPSEPSDKKKPNPLVIGAAVAGVGLILFGSWLVVWRDKTDPADVDDTAEMTSTGGAAQGRVAGSASNMQAESPAVQERRRHIQQRGYYAAGDVDLMFARDGEEITFRGRLARVRMSGSGLTMYLEFSEEAPADEPRAYVMARNIVDGIRAEDFEPLVGKQLEIRGPVDIEPLTGTSRPRVRIKGREYIRVLGAHEDYELR